MKCFDEAEFIVIGTERGGKAPVALLARETREGLEFVGAAMVTLAATDRERFWGEMARLGVERPQVLLSGARAASSVRPELRVRARFLKGEEMLRHATLCALSPLTG